jgi:hypothetical protein
MSRSWLCLMGVLVIVLYIILHKYKQSTCESFGIIPGRTQCADLLIYRGNKIHLLQRNKANIPGVNPIIFNNLEEYSEYIDWQKANNIRCPILLLQQLYNTQNQLQYRILNDRLLNPQKKQPIFNPNEIEDNSVFKSELLTY